MLHEIAQVKKVLSFDELSRNIDHIRNTRRIVLCHGVFDLLHIGHIRHFQLAKKHGDLLVVTITPDRYVNKGPNRPCFTEQLRAEAIASLDCVDYVVINAWPTAIETIKKIRPNVYVKGSEYQDARNDITAKIEDEVNATVSVGGTVAFTDDITFSSSTLINQFFSPFSEEVLSYLTNFKERNKAGFIFEYLENAKNLDVLVVGEAIIDIYHFSDVIGKAGKEPILVAKHNSQETYLGGILALANHLSDFCKSVTCMTCLGEHGEYEDIIRANLKSNVNLVLTYKKNSPTIVKRRYLDEYLRQKLFEVYEINDDFFDQDQQNEFIASLTAQTASHDLTIVADYGHGIINEEAVSTLEKNSKFLAVNTQTNAGNNGFNCISKYSQADYVSIATRELQLNYRQKHLSTPEQLQRLMQEFNYKSVMITNGRNGSFSCRQGEEISKVPAFATSVVDRVGAGDAVLAITSLFAYFGAPAELIGFIGNVVGAEAVGIMGNKQFIEKVSLMKHISHLLK